jgi:hypothetical protein
VYKQREREREYTQRVISRAFVAIVSVVRRTGGHPTSVHINRLSTGHSSLDFVVCLRVAVNFPYIGVWASLPCSMFGFVGALGFPLIGFRVVLAPKRSAA